MAHSYAQVAKELKEKYVAENAVLASWHDELFSPSAGSPESNLEITWREGWMGYMNVVIAIGAEKIAALEAIIDASEEDVEKLVARLQQDYADESDHYTDLQNQSNKRGTPTLLNLASLLEQEARDRQDYSAEF